MDCQEGGRARAGSPWDHGQDGRDTLKGMIWVCCWVIPRWGGWRLPRRFAPRNDKLGRCSCLGVVGG